MSERNESEHENIRRYCRDNDRRISELEDWKERFKKCEFESIDQLTDWHSQNEAKIEELEKEIKQLKHNNLVITTELFDDEISKIDAYVLMKKAAEVNKAYHELDEPSDDFDKELEEQKQELIGRFLADWKWGKAFESHWRKVDEYWYGENPNRCICCDDFEDYWLWFEEKWEKERDK